LQTKKLSEKLLPIFLANQTFSISDDHVIKKYALKKGTEKGLVLTDRICRKLESFGFVALAVRSDLESDRIVDWAQDLSDLQLNIPLDKDITLESQLLLQEQGYLIYPDFGRFVITAALRNSLQGLGQVVTSDEYYMDTNYNSDPNLFEVKQVLLNIVIDSA